MSSRTSFCLFPSVLMCIGSACTSGRLTTTCLLFHKQVAVPPVSCSDERLPPPDCSSNNSEVVRSLASCSDGCQPLQSCSLFVK